MILTAASCPSRTLLAHRDPRVAAAVITHSNLFDADDLPEPARMIVVDAGHSFTHVIPVIDGKVDHANIRRYE